MEGENVPFSNSGGTSSVEYVKPSFQMYGFGAEISEMPVYYQILKMENSLFLWIGPGTNPTFTDLSMAINTNYDTLPLSTRLMGHTDMTSTNLASRLSKKLKKTVYVSFNLPADRLSLPAVEQRLQEEIKAHPENFVLPDYLNWEVDSKLHGN